MNTLAPLLADLPYKDLLEIVRNRSAVKDYRTINQADTKARGILAKRGEAAWMDRVCENHNALTRGIRKMGWVEIDAFTVACAAVEEATVGWLAKSELTEAEFLLLVGPVGRAVAPWLLDGSEPPAVAPEAVKAATEEVAGSLVKVRPSRPTRAPKAAPVEDDDDDDPFGLAALSSLPSQTQGRTSLLQRAG